MKTLKQCICCGKEQLLTLPRCKACLTIQRRSYLAKRYNTPLVKVRVLVYQVVRADLKKKGIKSQSISSVWAAIGYTPKEALAHLEANFKDWMNFNNWGKYKKKTWDDQRRKSWTWGIGHIKPRNTFKYDSIDDKGFKRCWALNNLQPVSSKEITSSLVVGRTMFSVPKNGKKTCIICKKSKKLSGFYLRNVPHVSYYSCCITCRIKTARDYRSSLLRKSKKAELETVP